MSIFARNLTLVFLAKVGLSYATVIAYLPIKNHMTEIKSFAKDFMENFTERNNPLTRRNPEYVTKAKPAAPPAS